MTFNRNSDVLRLNVGGSERLLRTANELAAVIHWQFAEWLLLVVKSQRPSQIACQIPDVGIDVESGCSEPARRGHELCAHS